MKDQTLNSISQSSLTRWTDISKKRIAENVISVPNVSFREQKTQMNFIAF